MTKFNVGDTIRLTSPSNALIGMEGRIVSFGRKSDFGRWIWDVPIIKITKAARNPWYKDSYPVGSMFPRGNGGIENLTESSYELVTPNGGGLPRVIQPNEVMVGDKIQIDWTSDEIERRDTGVVASVKTSLPEFRNKLHVNIGPIVADDRTITLLERNVSHPLEEVVVGHVFKRQSLTGATAYKLTKLRDGYWAKETTKGAHFINIVIVGEEEARKVFDTK